MSFLKTTRVLWQVLCIMLLLESTNLFAQIELRAPFHTAVPVIDGIINVSEWQNARQYDLTFYYYLSSETVVMPAWFLNDGTYLYVASKAPFPTNNSFYFALYLDGDHSHTLHGSFTEPHITVNYNKAGSTNPAWQGYDDYRIMQAGCTVYSVTPPVGAQHAFSGTNPLSFEFRIPLSDLTVLPGGTTGLSIGLGVDGVYGHNWSFPVKIPCDDISQWANLVIETGLPASNAPFCDDFEDGNGWQSRWTVGHGFPTLVSSPTHGGSGALQMVQQQTGVDCHSSVFRKGFAANNGTYSAWFRQEYWSHFELDIQSDKLDGDPFSGTCYRFLFSAPHSGLPDGGFGLFKNVAGAQVELVPWAPVTFAMNEWVKAFVMRKPGGVIIAGYEQTNGFRDSLIFDDPDPIEAPGAFYLWTCSDWGQYNYYDDACYQPLPPVQTTVWFDSTTIHNGFIQVMMKNTFDVAAFTIPLLHNSTAAIDSVSKVGCRTSSWQDIYGTSFSDSTILVGGIARTSGSQPCMPPGEGPVARIYFQSSCTDTFTVCFDTTYISEPAMLVVTECSVPPVSHIPEFIAGCARYTRWNCGDVNDDCLRNISDVVHLICYIFTGCVAPSPLCTGDVNGDGAVNISDAVYYIAWIFVGGPEPVCACYLGPVAAKIAVPNAEVYYASRLGIDISELSVSFDGDAVAKGLQLEFETSNDIQITGVRSNIEGMDVFSGTVDGLFKVGLLDMTGKTVIPAGQHDVVTITYASTTSTGSGRTEEGSSGRTGDDIKLVNAIVVGEDASEMNVTITNLSAGRTASTQLPESFSLSQNIPNPFNPTTEINYALPKASSVRLEVLNVLGQVVRTLVDEYKVAGSHKAVWDGRDNNQQSVASGIYLYRITASEFAETRKMVLMK